MINKKYNPGEVVICLYPFDENEGDEFKYKDRPVLILRQEGDDEYKCLKITSTDWTGREIGFWINKSHSEYLEMNIDNPSYIRVLHNAIFKTFMFKNNISPVGRCSEEFTETVIQLCEANRI